MQLSLSGIHTTKEDTPYIDRGPQSFWRLPGFARPVWILDREFYATATSPARKDRIYVKLNTDNTVKIFNRRRPWIQWLKPKPRPKYEELETDIYDSVGTWTGHDESKDGLLFHTYKLTIEINEGLQKGRTKHEARTNSWGRMDGYAPFFRPGKLYKFKGSQNGVDVRFGEYETGNLMIRCNVQRPLVSKDFLAFQ